MEAAGFRGRRQAWTAHPQRRAPTLEGLTPTARQIAIIDLCFAATCVGLGIDSESGESVSAVQDLIVDVSQGIERGSWGRSLSTITTSNRSYLFGRDRLATSIELLQVYGWPVPRTRIHRLSSGQLLDLVAECMPLQALTVPFLALICAMGDRLPGVYATHVNVGELPPICGSVAAAGGHNLN